MAWHGKIKDDPVDFEKKNRIHWAKNLEPYFDIQNVAFPGSTNASIAYRLANSIKKQKPDYIVLGFTEFTRLEYSDYLTNVWPEISQDKSAISAWENYVKYADDKYMLYKNIVIAEYAITLARSVAKTCFVNNLFTYTLNSDQKKFILENQSLVNLYTERLSMQLTGHKEIRDPAHLEFTSYHVADPKIHKKFAQHILDTFDIDTNNKEVVN